MFWVSLGSYVISGLNCRSKLRSVDYTCCRPSTLFIRVPGYVRFCISSQFGFFLVKIPIFHLHHSDFLRVQRSDLDQWMRVWGRHCFPLLSGSMKAFDAMNFPLITPLPESYRISCIKIVSGQHLLSTCDILVWRKYIYLKFGNRQTGKRMMVCPFKVMLVIVSHSRAI